MSVSQRGDTRENQEKNHVLAPELAELDLRVEGFEILAREDDFILYPDGGRQDWLILARRPKSAAGQAVGEDDDGKRERDLRIPEIVRALELVRGSKVADIGAGEGFYEISLSRAVESEGRVYAEDIADSAIKKLQERVDKRHLANVEVIHGAPDDPKLPAEALDGALMVTSYHEVADYEKMLQHVRAALKPGGRFIVVDQSPHKTLARPRADQTKNHVIAADIAESEFRQAGFEVVSRDDRFIDNPDEESTRWMIVCRKPETTKLRGPKDLPVHIGLHVMAGCR
jgi:predicted methyltransferase